MYVPIFKKPGIGGDSVKEEERRVTRQTATAISAMGDKEGAVGVLHPSVRSSAPRSRTEGKDLGTRDRPGPRSSKKRKEGEEERREERREEEERRVEEEKRESRREEREEVVWPVRRAVSSSSTTTLEELSIGRELGPVEGEPILTLPEEAPHQQPGGAPEDGGQVAPAEASSRVRDSRGRKAKDPAHAGQFSGVGRAREELRKSRYAQKMAEEEIAEREAQREAARMGITLKGGARAAVSSTARDERSRSRSKWKDPAKMSVGELAQAVEVAAGSVVRLASESRNLKGTSIRDFKDAARDINEKSSELHRRALQTGDADGLRAEVADLRLKNEFLQQEILALQATVEALKARLANSTLGLRDCEPVPSPSASMAVDPVPPPAVIPQPAPLPQREVRKRRRNSRSSSPEPFAVPTRPPPKRVERKVEAVAPDLSKPVMPPPPPPPPHPTPEGGKKKKRPSRKRRKRERTAEESVASDPFKRLEAILDRKLGAFRQEILAEVRPGPRITRVETLVPPGGKRGVVNAALLRERHAADSKSKPPAPPAKRAAAAAQQPPAVKGAPKKAPPPPAAKAPAATKPASVSPAKTAETWATVVGRRAKTAAAKAARGEALRKAPQVPASAPKGKGGALKGAKTEGQKARPRAKIPRAPPASAITLTIPEGCDWTLERAMNKLKAEVFPSALGKTGVRPRRAATGALILTVPGEGGAEKAQKLALLSEVALRGTGVRVARPVKRAEMRITDLADATTKEEVLSALAVAGGCPEADVRVGDIRLGPSGLGTLWAQVPLAAARRVAAASDKRDLCIGWVIARAEVLATRPMQCFRCLETGHPRQRCTAKVDRSNRCYRCGESGHRAAQCEAPPKCPLCTDLGRASNHRLGAPQCAPPSARRKGGAAAAKPKPSPAVKAAPKGGAEKAPVAGPSKEAPRKGVRRVPVAGPSKEAPKMGGEKAPVAGPSKEVPKQGGERALVAGPPKETGGGGAKKPVSH